MKTTLTFLITLFASTLIGATAPTEAQIQEASNAFYYSQYLKTVAGAEFLDELPDECKPNSGECTKYICGLFSWPGCNNQATALEVVKACSGNYGQDCVKDVCSRFSWPGCANKETALMVAKSCAHNYGNGCVKNVCDRFSWPGCANQATALEVVKACKGSDGDCINQVCKGFSWPGCANKETALKVARACAGD